MARTARQRAALRKAQLASARKRRGKGKGKLAAANRKYSRKKRNDRIWRGVAIGAAIIGTGVRVSAARRGHKSQRNHILYKPRRGSYKPRRAGGYNAMKSPLTPLVLGSPSKRYYGLKQ